MNNIFNLSVLLIILSNFSCAQDLKPIDSEADNSILVDESNYEMELIFEDENIIWSIEFFEDNSILAAVKSGKLFHYINGEKIEISGLPEIYLRGQGGLMDIVFHPDFKENNWLYFSYASEDAGEKGGNTTISRAKLINNNLGRFRGFIQSFSQHKKRPAFWWKISF
jgi:glucose/arabinose dehydrogenase